MEMTVALTALLRGRTRRASQVADEILDAVAAALDAPFGAVTRSVLHGSLTRQLQRPDPRFELIVDNVVNANWRLTATIDGGIRLASHHLFPGDSVAAAQQEANRRIDAILATP